MDWLDTVSLYLSTDDFCAMRLVSQYTNAQRWQRMLYTTHKRRMQPTLWTIQDVICIKEETERESCGSSLRERSVVRYIKPKWREQVIIYTSYMLEPAYTEFMYNCKCDMYCECEPECYTLGRKCTDPQLCVCSDGYKLRSWAEFPHDFMRTIKYKPPIVYSPTDSYQMVELINSHEESVYIVSILLPSEVLNFSADRESKLNEDWETYFM
jgi:hypothetical protein